MIGIGVPTQVRLITTRMMRRGWMGGVPHFLSRRSAVHDRLRLVDGFGHSNWQTVSYLKNHETFNQLKSSISLRSSGHERSPPLRSSPASWRAGEAPAGSLGARACKMGGFFWFSRSPTFMRFPKYFYVLFSYCSSYIKEQGKVGEVS